MALTIGVDVGGTKIAAGVVDESGTVLDEAVRRSPATDTEAIEEAIADAVAALARRYEVVGVGVGAAGFVDAARSTVLIAPNLAWRDEPLKAELERRTGLPVVVENDANAAAWGEFQYGAGHDVDDLLLVTVGTGVGGGLVLDGALYRGAFGIAAEIGHMRVVPNGRECGCGNLGCWEQYASGTALVRTVHEDARTGSAGATALLELAGGDVEGITGRMVTQAARDGDGYAREKVDEIGRWLGEGIATLAAVLDPATVALGGGVADAGELLTRPAADAFRATLTGRGHRPELEIRKAQLGNQAGLIGAADLSRR
ncbi:MAG: ROK family glucokinase [Actinomycetota bacterium]|nr:ROK family glucokinase [Actinomycetota bacterium]